jgi:hypothetical protein
VDKGALKTLSDANFAGFLQGTPPKFDKTTRTLQLHEGSSRTKVPTNVAADLQSFLVDLNPKLSGQETDFIYMAAMECLENVRIHAYDPAQKVANNWYTVGLYDVSRDCSTVAILDLGLGMRATVQRQLSDFYKAVEWFTRPTYSLIEEATLGLRTASGERHRGKGLSTLREFAAGQPNRRLSVFSRDGMVSWVAEDGEQICISREIPEFNGTIVCLEIGARPPP